MAENGGGAVVVVGGGGFYGRYLVADLIEHTDVQVITVGRRPTRWADGRVSGVVADLHDRRSMTRLLDGARVVVHCAGPFEKQPLEVVDAAIEVGADYVDIAENREFASLIRQRAPAAVAAGVRVLTGASVAPGMELIVAASVADEFATLDAVRTFAAPDSRKHRGAAMFETMLYGAGRSFDEPTVGGARRRYGWSAPERIEFPEPIGWRRAYLIFGMADLDLLPETFAVGEVQFRAGSELEFLNRLLQAAAWWRHTVGHPRWERMTGPIRAMSKLVGLFGRDEGAVIIETHAKGNTRGYRACVIGVPDGGRIPILLAGLAVEKLLNSQEIEPGVHPAHVWATRDDLFAACSKRGLRALESVLKDQEWSPWKTPDPRFGP